MRTRTLAVFLVCLVACGDDDAVSSPNDNITREEKVVGPAGGTLALSDGTKVEIPAGALTTDVTIVIRELDSAKPLPVNLEQAGKPYAFEPHGTLFSRPVKVTLPYDEARDDRLDVRPVKTNDADDETWRTIVGADKSDGKLEFDVLSFSIYRAARPNRTSGWITLPDGAAFYPDSGTIDAGSDASNMIDAGGDASDAIDAGNDAEVDASDSGTPPNDSIFVDANLEIRVRQTLNIPTDPLTQQDLDLLTTLDTLFMPIASLIGIERCTNLVSLTIGSATFDDITPLAALPSLTSLTIHGDGMTAPIAVLGSMRSLRALDLSGTSATGTLSDINTLTDLLLLSLTRTDVTGDLSDISALNSLQALYVAITSISGDIMTLSDVTSLHLLHGYDAPIGGDLAVFSGFDLRELWLGDFNAGDSSGGTVTGELLDLSSSTLLSRLSLSGPFVTVTGNLSDLPDGVTLLYLTLTGEGFSGELDSVGSFINLRSLDLSYASITGDIEDIGALSALQFLVLADTGVGGSLSTLANMPNLMTLNITDGNLTGDLSSLAALEFLEVLYLSGNSAITGSFADLVTIPLHWLGVSNTSVTMDFAPLSANVGNHRLNAIDATGNPIDCTAQAESLATLRAANTTVNVDCP